MLGAGDRVSDGFAPHGHYAWNIDPCTARVDVDIERDRMK
jgi:hypothetical protein